MKLFRKDEGFTLVELMVVVLIIGILIAIAIPIFNSARSNAQKRACQASQRTVEGAYQAWYAENATVTANLTALTEANMLATMVTDEYIKAAPTCPAGGTLTVVLNTATTKLTADVQCSITTPDHDVY